MAAWRVGCLRGIMRDFTTTQGRYTSLQAAALAY
jgi:hypothetical protein